MFRPAEEHGAFTEVFPDVFVVTGSFRINPEFSITRNMFVLRQAGQLTIVSSMRLMPHGEGELEKLGDVKHVVRIGGLHGADDPYYVDRYAPTYWAPEKLREGPKIDRALAPGASPIDGAEVFLFEKGNMGEAIIRLDREGGILLTADSFQNWTTFDGCSDVARTMMPRSGFGPSVIGGPWLKAQGEGVRADFERLATLDFAHALPGHGTPLKDAAKAGLAKATAERFAK